MSLYTKTQIEAIKDSYKTLLYADSWRVFYKELKLIGFLELPFTSEFMVTFGEEFNIWVNKKMDEDMSRFFLLMDNFLFRLKRLNGNSYIDGVCECVIRIKDIINGMEYYTDELRPATKEDFERFKKIAAEQYASFYDEIDFSNIKVA